MDAERKCQLTKRLVREGRWPEAEEWKNRRIRKHRDAGMLRPEASDVAWREMSERFSPIEVEDDIGADNTPDLPFGGVDETVLPPSAVRGRVPGLADIPAGWPELPANASLQADLNWVQAERLTIVGETATGATVVSLSRASTPAPSMGALGWLETSIRSYAKYVDVLVKSLKDEVDEQEQVKRERAKIEDIRGILAEMNDQWAEELVANTSETVRTKVRSITEDWAARSGLTIPDKAKADLGAHIGELVDDCVGILAPSAGGE